LVELHEQGSLAKVYRKEIELPFGEKLLVKEAEEQNRLIRMSRLSRPSLKLGIGIWNPSLYYCPSKLNEIF